MARALGPVQVPELVRASEEAELGPVQVPELVRAAEEGADQPSLRQKRPG